MATLQEKLAESLAVLKEYQDKHPDNLVIKGMSILGRTHTKRLVDNGYLQMVIKGWYIPSSPGSEGDSTVWYVSYWWFVVAYLESKFGSDWSLSQELSLYFYSGKTVIPKQLVVRSEKASNNILQLPFGTSILDIKASVPDVVEKEPRYGLRLYPKPVALLMVSPDYFRRNPIEARICLSSVQDVTPIVAAAIDGGHTTRAGRLAGAFRSIGREEMADTLLRTMKKIGYEVKEENPFEDKVDVRQIEPSPYASRIQLLWMQMRKTVLSLKPASAKRSENEILSQMDSGYIKDSYNSLSIEGYRVTEMLLERVRRGDWEPGRNKEDANRRDALAARGYYQAYQLLRQSIAKVLAGENAAEMYSKGHQEWHFQLFEPCIRAGIIKVADLLGYRTHQVYIRGSRHTPLNPEAVLDAMAMLSEMMIQEPDAFVRAILGHFFFVYIHPYMDGNGRTARFTMNSQLVTGGYNWVVVPVEQRDKYMQVLERASVDEEIEDFVRFIVSLM